MSARLDPVAIDPRDPRFDVSAKFALNRLLKTPSRNDAAGMVRSVQAGRLSGIYGDDLKVVADLAKRYGTYRWLLVAPTERATLVLNPDNPVQGPPYLVYRSNLRATPSLLDQALLTAWEAFKLFASGGLNCGLGSLLAELDEVTGGPAPNVFPPCQLQKPPAGKGKFVIIVAGGFRYESQAEELSILQDVKKGVLLANWFPNTPDFEGVLGNTIAQLGQSGISKANAVDEESFFGALAQFKSINRVAFIGHGSGTSLGLAGKTDRFGITFTNSITSSHIRNRQSDIDSQIRGNFRPGATFDIYACGVASPGRDFVRTLSNALGICVRAFPGTVETCVEFDDQRIRRTGQMQSTAELAILRQSKGRLISCNDPTWRQGIVNFEPPDKTCPSSSLALQRPRQAIPIRR